MSRKPDGTPAPRAPEARSVPDSAGLERSVRSVGSVSSICSVRSVTFPSYSEQLIAAVQQGVAATRALRPWPRALFAFARHLKPAAAAYHVAASNVGVLEPAVRAWHAAAQPAAGWTDVWAEFVTLWPRVKYAAGAGLLDAIVARLTEPGYWPTEEQTGYDCSRTRHLLALCHALADAAGQPFYLAVGTAQRVCGFANRMTTWRRLKLLAADGWIQEVQAGTKTKAARYVLRRKPPEEN